MEFWIFTSRCITFFKQKQQRIFEHWQPFACIQLVIPCYGFYSKAMVRSTLPQLLSSASPSLELLRYEQMSSGSLLIDWTSWLCFSTLQFFHKALSPKTLIGWCHCQAQVTSVASHYLLTKGETSYKVNKAFKNMTLTSCANFLISVHLSLHKTSLLPDQTCPLNMTFHPLTLAVLLPTSGIPFPSMSD